MARLIDANKFGMYLADVQLANSGWKEDFCDMLETVMDMLNEQPTVEAVPVVRCKDCKNWHKETAWCDEHSYFMGYDWQPCYPDESQNWKMFGEDYFCADGERRCEDAVPDHAGG